MELIHYWKVIRKRWWLILILVLGALGSSYYFTYSQPAEYESSASLLLNPSLPSEFIAFYQGTAAANLADSYTELLHSESFADLVAKQLPFPMEPEQISAAISTRLVQNTLFYRITGQANNAEQARQLVDTVVKVFISTNAIQKQQETQAGGKSAAVVQLEEQLKELSQEVADYQAEIKQRMAAPPSKERDDQLLPLRQQLASLQQTQAQLLVAAATLSDQTKGGSSAVVMDPPRIGRALPRRVLNNLVFAAVAALILSIGLVFLIDYLDYTVRSPDQLEDLLHVRPLAVIGNLAAGGGWSYGDLRRKRKHRNGGTAVLPTSPVPAALAAHNLVTVTSPRSPEAETFRVLRTNIQFSGVDTQVRSLVITSSGPGEGKSFTAANLAIVMAQAGKRTILVDTDLRRPSVHKLFELPNTRGFTNLILDEKLAVQDAIQWLPDFPHLGLITSGPIPPNPSEILSSARAAQVMAEVRDLSEIVIFDTPPAAAVTDPVILATRVDGVILVINAEQTRRDLVRRVKQSLETVGVKLFIPVLNRVRERDLRGYYYYYTDYSSQVTPPPADGPSANGHSPLPAAAEGSRR